mmetsp:Transcript_18884/g.21727  ORF Transcript_18884/g.21727 Transcript_18884/m.21727 type:complete len:740 (+) Transcript_18884:179-2398(+)
MAATSIVGVIEALNQECIEEVARMKESYELSHKTWLDEVFQVTKRKIRESHQSNKRLKTIGEVQKENNSPNRMYDDESVDDFGVRKNIGNDRLGVISVTKVKEAENRMPKEKKLVVDEMKVVDLRKELKRRGLDTAGVKKVLQKRLVEATTTQTKISSKTNKMMPATDDSRLTKDETSQHQKGAFSEDLNESNNSSSILTSKSAQLLSSGKDSDTVSCKSVTNTDNDLKQKITAVNEESCPDTEMKDVENKETIEPPPHFTVNKQVISALPEKVASHVSVQNKENIIPAEQQSLLATTDNSNSSSGNKKTALRKIYNATKKFCSPAKVKKGNQSNGPTVKYDSVEGEGQLSEKMGNKLPRSFKDKPTNFISHKAAEALDDSKIVNLSEEHKKQSGQKLNGSITFPIPKSSSSSKAHFGKIPPPYPSAKVSSNTSSTIASSMSAGSLRAAKEHGKILALKKDKRDFEEAMRARKTEKLINSPSTFGSAYQSESSGNSFKNLIEKAAVNRVVSIADAEKTQRAQMSNVQAALSQVQSNQNRVPQSTLSSVISAPVMTDKDKKQKGKLLADQMRAKAAAETKKNTAFTLSGSKHPLTVKNQSSTFSSALAKLQPNPQKVAMQKNKSPKVLSPMDTYEMSDKEESDSDEESSSDEEESGPKKRVPSWARNTNLVSALEHQFKDSADRVDPDAIFPEVSTCDLEAIFDQKKARYKKRTSSGNWTKDKVTAMEKLTYKRHMGFKS